MRCLTVKLGASLLPLTIAHVPVMEGQRWTSCNRLIIVVLYIASTLTAADGAVRLVGYTCAGRVEFSNATRVCSNNWDLNDAKVVCRELNCSEAVRADRSSFGSGSGNGLMGVECSGGETSLSKCKNSGFGSCSSDAGVVCSNGIKPEISKHPVSEVIWGDSSSIKCSIPSDIHQLTQGTFKLTKNSHVKKTKTITNSAKYEMSKVTFEDEGQYKCCYDIPGRNSDLCSSVVHLTVTVNLQAPSISASSPDDQQQQRAWDDIQVTRGYRFVINCSTQAHYPEGRFFLQFSGFNRNISERSVNHSASFHFPVSQDEHQGNYSCVYQVTGPGQTYTSPQSSAIRVTVKQPLLPVILPVVGGSLLLLVLAGLYFFYRRRRRQRVVEFTAPTPTPMTPANEYKESDDEEEADYVNVSPGKGDEENGLSSESDDEPDYVNVNEPCDENTLDIYGGDDSIYQNY